MPASQPSEKTRPQTLPEWVSIIQITLTAIIMMYSFNIGAFSIVAFYALWLPLYAFRPDLVLRKGDGTVLVLLLPLFCLYSALWSQHPSLTFYLATQFFTAVLSILALARTATMTAVAKGIALGVTIIMALTIASGVYQISGMTGEAALVGYLGSKNQVGVNATIALLCSFLLLTTHSSLPGRLIFSVLPILVSLIALYLCKSVTSLFTLAAAIGCIASIWAVTRFHQRLRLPLLAASAGILLVFAVLAAALDISVSDATLSSAGKDSTLTGRTILWNEGLAIAATRPMLGHGYAAFWVQDNPAAEYLWNRFDVPRTGFHFHSMYVQTLVDLGLTGTLILAVLVLATLGMALRRSLRHGVAMQYSLPLGLAVMFSIRSFFELDFLGNYHMGTLVMYMLLPLMAATDRRIAAGGPA